MTQDCLAPFDTAHVAHFANPKAVQGRSSGGQSLGGQRTAVLSPAAVVAAAEQIGTWPGYSPTPLVALTGLARAAGLEALWYKDEGGRFGLGSFKALGGAYAVSSLLADQLQSRQGIAGATAEALRGGRYRDLTAAITVASATDGNHGRSVAWGARQFGCRCVIYIHAEVSAGREAALRDQGAEVIRVDGNYDASVARCAADAAEKGWFVVSDTSWEGYRDIPRRVMAGYSVLVSEAIEQLAGQRPTHVFVQGGVGGIAATVLEVLWQVWGEERPRFIVVEPELAACLYASAGAGRPQAVEVEEETLMAGLSCGEISLLAWDSLGTGADDFMTIPENLVAPAMRLLADGPDGDQPLVAGESAVAGLAGLLAACRSPELAAALGLGGQSRVMVFGTEGATDPVIYEELTGRPPEAVSVSS